MLELPGHQRPRKTLPSQCHQSASKHWTLFDRKFSDGRTYGTARVEMEPGLSCKSATISSHPVLGDQSSVTISSKLEYSCLLHLTILLQLRTAAKGNVYFSCRTGASFASVCLQQHMDKTRLQRRTFVRGRHKACRLDCCWSSTRSLFLCFDVLTDQR